MDRVINQSLIQVDVPSDDLKGGLEALNIDKIKEQQYKSAVDTYLNLICGPSGVTQVESGEEFIDEEFVDHETERVLLALPEKDAKRIVSFVKRVMGRYPESTLENNMPINEIHIKALFAAVYNREYHENNGNIEDEDLYIRILTALEASNHHIGYRVGFTGVGSTLGALERYKSRDLDGNNFYKKEWGIRGAVGNTAIRVIAATMPIVELPSYDGKRSEELPILEEKFYEFQNNLLEEVRRYKQVLGGLCERYFPGREIRYPKRDLPIFAGGIEGEVPATNNIGITEMAPYLDVVAGGITNGYDTVTGLPLTLIELPFGWDKSASPLLDEGKLSQNAIYRTAGVILHELIHEQTKFYPENLLETIVNELLTDSLTKYVQLLAHGKDFNEENYEHTAPGYDRLVLFAMGLVTQGIISEEDIIKNALNQDPTSFLNKIFEAVRTRDGIAEELIRTMQRYDMILPLRSDQVQAAVIECKKDPKTFFREKFKKAIEEFGFGYSWHKSSLMYFVSKIDPSFIQEQIRVWAEKLGRKVEDIELDSLYLLLDHQTGVYHDRVVDLYYQKKRMEGSNLKQYYLNASDIYKFVENAHSGKNTIFQSNELNELHTDRQVHCLIVGDNVIYKYIDYFVLPKVKDKYGQDVLNSEAILEKSAEVVEKLHQGLSKIISAQYPGIDNGEKEDLVYNLIVDLVPKLDPLDDITKYTDLDDAVNEILARIAILMEGDGDDKWSIPQIIHYGPYVMMDKDLVGSYQERLDRLKSLRR